MEQRDALVREVLGLLGDGASRAEAERLVEWHLSHTPEPSLPPIGAIAEVAAALGVARTTASTWLYRRKLDVDPVATLSVGAIYNLDEVLSRVSEELILKTRSDTGGDGE